MAKFNNVQWAHAVVARTHPRYTANVKALGRLLGASADRNGRVQIEDSLARHAGLSVEEMNVVLAYLRVINCAGFPDRNGVVRLYVGQTPESEARQFGSQPFVLGSSEWDDVLELDMDPGGKRREVLRRYQESGF